MEEILISSDVSVSTAAEVVGRVKKRAMDEKLKDGDYVISILRDVLVDILEESEVEEPAYPCVIMLVGVNGVGKTTTVGQAICAAGNGVIRNQAIWQIPR